MSAGRDSVGVGWTLKFAGAGGSGSAKARGGNTRY
jgi:hypothetical protein